MLKLFVPAFCTSFCDRVRQVPIFRSPEPKVYWWAYMIGRPPSSVCRPHSLNTFSAETTGSIEAKFHMESPWDKGTKICSNGPGHIIMMAPYAFVWAKGKTMDFSETIVVYDLKLATDDRSDKKFLLTSKLCPLGALCPLPWGYIHVVNHGKNV